MLQYITLLFGVGATVGLLWLLVSRFSSGGSDEDFKRAGVLLIVVGYAVAELVPSQFVTVTPAVDLASGAVALLCLGLGAALVFGDYIVERLR